MVSSDKGHEESTSLKGIESSKSVILDGMWGKFFLKQHLMRALNNVQEWALQRSAGDNLGRESSKYRAPEARPAWHDQGKAEPVGGVGGSRRGYKRRDR